VFAVIASHKRNSYSRYCAADCPDNTDRLLRGIKNRDCAQRQSAGKGMIALKDKAPERAKKTIMYFRLPINFDILRISYKSLV
jgi:hypothetical protein